MTATIIPINAAALLAHREMLDATVDQGRNAVIARIRAALKERSGKAWSVTGGRGTAYGWIDIDAPPSRRTWRTVETGPNVYEQRDSGRPGGHGSPTDHQELAALLGLDAVHFQGAKIPSGHDYYCEYIDRAEGREPTIIGKPYWD